MSSSDKNVQNEDDSEAAWNDYLNQRPDFRRWYEQRLEKAGYSDQLGPFREDLKQLCGYIFGPYRRRLVLMHDNIISQDNTDGILDFDDGEALAYVVRLGPDEETQYLMAGSINNVGRPSISFDELNLIGRPFTYIGTDYLVIPCLKANHDDTFGILGVANLAKSILTSINGLSPIMNHVRWDTDEDFFRTICEYGGKANIFRSPCSNMTIDKDYLDHYLLVHKPSPNEVSEKNWHDRSVRLVEQLDKDANDVEEYSAAIPDKEDATTVRFNDFMATTLLDCFLTHNMEDLTFMDTIYGFCTDLFPDDHNWRCHTGAFKSEVFDMLRKYGPSFTGPLFENALSERVL